MHRRVRVAWLAEQHLHPEFAGELTDAIDLANLLERDDIGIDAPQHGADEVEPALAAEQDVIGGDANPAATCFFWFATSTELTMPRCSHSATHTSPSSSSSTQGPIALRCLAVAIAAAACGVAGTLLVRLHETLASRARSAHGAQSSCRRSSPTGSCVRTLWPGWVAALCFGAAVLRLRHGATEPPPGRNGRRTSDARPAARRPAPRVSHRPGRARDRAALRRGRCGPRGRRRHRGASGDTADLATMPATVVEALGYVVAALVLAAWARAFGYRGAPARRAVSRRTHTA